MFSAVTTTTARTLVVRTTPEVTGASLKVRIVMYYEIVVPPTS
jgi:hypothetical protein